MTATTAVWCAHTWRDTTPCTTSAAGHRCRLAHVHAQRCRCYCGAEVHEPVPATDLMAPLMESLERARAARNTTRETT